MEGTGTSKKDHWARGRALWKENTAGTPGLGRK